MTTDTNEHLQNIGRIVLHIARSHELGDWGDCSINHPIVSVVDQGRPSHELLRAPADMDRKTAAGICGQLGDHQLEHA
jgi:hypothetical protein